MLPRFNRALIFLFSRWNEVLRVSAVGMTEEPLGSWSQRHPDFHQTPILEKSHFWRISHLQGPLMTQIGPTNASLPMSSQELKSHLMKGTSRIKKLYSSRLFRVKRDQVVSGNWLTSKGSVLSLLRNPSLKILPMTGSNISKNQLSEKVASLYLGKCFMIVLMKYDLSNQY